MQRLLDHQEEIPSHFRQERQRGNQFRCGELTIDTSVSEILYAVSANMTDEIVQRIILRVHRPDNFTYVIDELRRPLRDLLDMLSSFVRRLLGQFTQNGNLGQTGSH